MADKPIFPVLALALLLGGSPVLQSCLDQQTTTATISRAADPGSASSGPSDQQTPTSTTTSSEPDSVVGSTLHAVGTMILFPFRLIGDAIDLMV